MSYAQWVIDNTPIETLVSRDSEAMNLLILMIDRTKLLTEEQKNAVCQEADKRFQEESASEKSDEFSQGFDLIVENLSLRYIQGRIVGWEEKFLSSPSPDTPPNPIISWDEAIPPNGFASQSNAYLKDNTAWCIVVTFSVEREKDVFAKMLTWCKTQEKVVRKSPTETSPLPMRLPQQTFEEMRVTGTALADTPTLRRWSNVEGQIAIRHVIEDTSKFQTLIIAGSTLQWWGLPNTHEALRNEVQHLGIDGFFLMQFVLGLSLMETQRHVTVSLDDLILLIGKKDEARKSAAKRAELRRWTWRALCLFSNMSVIGTRLGKYKGANGIIDMTRRAEDCFISITGKEWSDQASTDDSTPPIIVHYVCGPWLEKSRGDKQILTIFADLRKLAYIPSGKAAGRWARSIGLGLNQKWRELSAYSEIASVGDKNVKTVRLKNKNGNDYFFTRRELLMGNSFFRADPDPEKILDSDDPGRARAYWNEAIKMLRSDYIGYYAEKEPLSAGRQNWANAWLEQKLDIRPKREGTNDMAEIAQSAKKAKASRKPRQSSASTA